MIAKLMSLKYNIAKMRTLKYNIAQTSERLPIADIIQVPAPTYLLPHPPHSRKCSTTTHTDHEVRFPYQQMTEDDG